MPASIPPIVSLRVSAAAEVRGHEVHMHFLLLLLLRRCEEHGMVAPPKKGQKNAGGKTQKQEVLNALSHIASRKPCSASVAYLSPASRSRLLLFPPLQPHHARASPLLEEDGGRV
jgi:hypothetical protein